jgi:glycine betaine/proline transport system ATP-binding protein
MQNEFMRLQDALHKTIVFITHDFEEAVRVGDRIAIMREGRVVQVGTPEDLVRSPADDYVAEFTRDAPRSKIFSARAIMRAPKAGEAIAGLIPAASKVREFAARVDSSELPFGVADESGQQIGVVDRRAVMSVLVSAWERA